MPKPNKLQLAVAEYLAALKSRDVAALKRAARNSRQVSFSKQLWRTEMEKQAKGDPELEKFIADARAAIAADLKAKQRYLPNPQPWSPAVETARAAQAEMVRRFGRRAAGEK